MAKQEIYADHAATTPLSHKAELAMQPYQQACFYNPSTKYSSARKAQKAVNEAREIIATCICAKPEEVYFTSSGTESDNWAIKGTAFRYPNQKKRIITSQIEHHAVLNSCAFLERFGYEVVYLEVNTSGLVNPDALKAAITSNTILISIMTANNEIGTIEPITELATIAHKYDIVFHSDAVQAVGHIPIDVCKMDVDMLSASAHKFGGPKGVGFLYIRDSVRLESFLHGGGQENSRRAGTENVASIVGMAAALEEKCATIENEILHLRALRSAFISGMKETGIDFCINGSEHGLPGIISLSIKGTEGEMLLHRLDLLGIQVATGSACDSKETKLSHVLQALKKYDMGTIRISFGIENTVNDVNTIVITLGKIFGSV